METSINKKCILIDTGHKGTIIYEMNSYDPPQFGIQWHSGKQIQELGMPYFWNDKTSVKIIES